MAIEIRTAILSDACQVHDYYIRLLDEKIPYIRDNPVPTVEQEVEFVRGFVEGPGDLLLAFHNLNVIGMLGMERSAHYQEKHRIHIGVSVQSEHRGNGLGTQLLKKAESWAKDNDVSSIELEVIANNPAVRLYKKLGYEVIGRVNNGFKVNREYLDVHYMQLIL